MIVERQMRGRPVRAKICVSLLAITAITSVVLDLRADEVELTDGGRVKGKVVVESPQEGVRVLLEDGTTYSVPAALVKKVTYGDAAAPALPPTGTTSTTPVPPGAQQAAGKLHVVSEVSGEIFIRNAARPRSTRESRGRVSKPGAAIDFEVGPGTWVVEVKFDSGGSDSARVIVDAGARVDVRLSTWSAQPWVAAHSGVHFGMMGHADIGFYPDVEEVGGGPSLEAFAAIGLSPAIELRLGGELSARVSETSGGSTS